MVLQVCPLADSLSLWLYLSLSQSSALSIEGEEREEKRDREERESGEREREREKGGGNERERDLVCSYLASISSLSLSTFPISSLPISSLSLSSLSLPLSLSRSLSFHLSEFWNGCLRVLCSLATAVAMGTPKISCVCLATGKMKWKDEVKKELDDFHSNKAKKNN